MERALANIKRRKGKKGSGRNEQTSKLERLQKYSLKGIGIYSRSAGKGWFEQFILPQAPWGAQILPTLPTKVYEEKFATLMALSVHSLATHRRSLLIIDIKEDLAGLFCRFYGYGRFNDLSSIEKWSRVREIRSAQCHAFPRPGCSFIIELQQDVSVLLAHVGKMAILPQKRFVKWLLTREIDGQSWVS